jgi:hypothetical protein
MPDSIELERIRISLRQLAHAARDTHETGFVTVQYKRQLVEMKWFIEDLLDTVGYFAGEEQWEQDRLVELLKRKEKSL